MASSDILINRAPVLTLWGAVVAERLGYDRALALTLGKAVAGKTAQGKGRMLGIYSAPSLQSGGASPPKSDLGEDGWIDLCERAIPVVHTPEGLRACSKAQPIDPESVRKYLEKSFGPSLASVREAMEDLARQHQPEALREAALTLYETFRPRVARGQQGWGQKGRLSLAEIRRAGGGRGR